MLTAQLHALKRKIDAVLLNSQDTVALVEQKKTIYKLAKVPFEKRTRYVNFCNANKEEITTNTCDVYVDENKHVYVVEHFRYRYFKSKQPLAASLRRDRQH